MDYTEISGKIRRVRGSEQLVKIARDLCRVKLTFVNCRNTRAASAVDKLLFAEHFNKDRRSSARSCVTCDCTHNFTFV